MQADYIALVGILPESVETRSGFVVFPGYTANEEAGVMRVLVGIDQIGSNEPEPAAWARALAPPELSMEWMHVTPARASGIWALDPFMAVDFAERQAESAARQWQSAS